MEEVKKKQVSPVLNKCSGRSRKKKFYFIYKITDIFKIYCVLWKYGLNIKTGASNVEINLCFIDKYYFEQKKKVSSRVMVLNFDTKAIFCQTVIFIFLPKVKFGGKWKMNLI